MVTWVLETQPPGSESRNAIDIISTLNGPVGDVESVFTDVILGRGPFGALTQDQRRRTAGAIRRCLVGLFKHIARTGQAPLYRDFAKRVQKDDVIVTFNYDVALENELIRTKLFRVRGGYGSSLPVEWTEDNSDVVVLKPHGSINWNGWLGAPGVFTPGDRLRDHPIVDNKDPVLVGYPARVLDERFGNGQVVDTSITVILPASEKRYSVQTSDGDEWVPFYESLWSQAAESLQQSDRIVMIGYSMPAADHRPRALLLWCANKRAEVTICCASSNAAMAAEFESHGFWRVHEVETFADLLNP
jgi:hypothetical protein